MDLSPPATRSSPPGTRQRPHSASEFSKGLHRETVVHTRIPGRTRILARLLGFGPFHPCYVPFIVDSSFANATACMRARPVLVHESPIHLCMLRSEPWSGELLSWRQLPNAMPSFVARTCRNPECNAVLG